MSQKKIRPTTRRSSPSPRLNQDIFRDVTADEVIKDLLQLFGHLGLDTTRFIRKVRDVDLPVIDAGRYVPHLSSIGDLLTLWHQDPRYLNESGDPIAIRMRGTSRSFRNLAERTAPNMSAKQLLLELERLHAVEIDARGNIRVRARTLPAYRIKQLALSHTLNALRGFIGTLTHNLNSGPSNADQLFHRIAWNGELDLNEIPRLKIWLKRHGQSLLESADNWMVSRSGNYSAARKQSRRVAQVAVGVYLAVEKT